MFCCKKRKARKAAKAQAIVSSLAAVESALEGKTAEMFAEKLTGNKKALNKARRLPRRPFVPLRRNWLVLSVTAASAPVRAWHSWVSLVALGGCRRRSLQRSSSRGGPLEERISVPASFFSKAF